MITDPHTEAIRKENEELKDRLAALEAKLSGAPARSEFVGERPMYRLLKPFYGPDNRYYDPEEGEDVINYTGTPNEHMEPMNEPARKRTIAWLESLPGKGILPLEFIVEAAAKLSHTAKDSPLPDFAGRVMAEAMRIRSHHEGKPVEAVELSLPKHVEDVPLMGNDRRLSRRSLQKDVISSAAAPEGMRRRPGPKRRIMGGGGPDAAIDIG